MSEQFFKSISLRLDAGKPEQFAHYYPTKKSANVIRSIVDGAAASIMVASYGSGKSLAAGTAALVVANEKQSRQTLKDIGKRINSVDRKLGKFVADRSRSRKKGLAILLEGYEESLPVVLMAKAKAGGVKSLHQKRDLFAALDAIAERARKQKIDRIAIIWDEFGQHLEKLVASGNHESLLAVQQIAEWAVRQKQPTVTFTLLLHQSLSQYSGSLSQSAKSSWRKIEGRFTSIQYVEDSDEFFKLVASVVKQHRPASLKLPSVGACERAAKKAVKFGFFKSFAQPKSLAKVFRDAYPLLPATLHELPKMASRLAQNERTVFTFLRTADFARPVSLRSLYQFFSASMQVDSGAGGTHRRWLETESALSKVAEPVEKEVLAAAAILSLGASGERQRVSKESLAYATSEFGGVSHKDTVAAIAGLLGRKLLLYRKNSDDISIWHGTDMDIRSRLQETINKLAGELDVVEFLQAEYVAPNLRPTQHNVDNAIRRFYRGRFVTASELCKQGEAHEALALDLADDGAVVYCIAESHKEVDDVKAFVSKYKSEVGERLLFAVPVQPLAVASLVAEVVALRQLQGDTELLAEDPLLLPELQHMIDAAQDNLAAVLHQLTTPNSRYNDWYANAKKLSVANEYDLQKVLSKFMDAVYHFTPIINNEMIVRHEISRQLKNARKKLIMGILERSNVAHLGFDKEATTPEVTFYRTILKRPGLFKEGKQGGVWAPPPRSCRGGVLEVWRELAEFYSSPAETEKSFRQLVDKLVAPPYGTRKGLVPILVAAGMKAFGKLFAIKHKGVYLPDILASQVEDMCTSPDEYTIDVRKVGKPLKQYLVGLNELFNKESENLDDLLRQLHDSIISWRLQLPKSALTTNKVSKKAKALQKVLRRDNFDPVELALVQLPKIVGYEWKDKKILGAIKSLIEEIEGIIEGYLASAVQLVREQLSISPDDDGDTLQNVQKWAQCFLEDRLLLDKLGLDAKAVVDRALQANSGRFTEASFANSLSTILLGQSFEKWDDTSAQLFNTRLCETVITLEHAAIASKKPSVSLQPLIQGRINYYQNVLTRLEKGSSKRKSRA